LIQRDVAKRIKLIYIQSGYFLSGFSVENEKSGMNDLNKENTKLQFVNPRKPQSADELTALEQQQLVIAGKLYDGEEYSVDVRLGSAEGETDEESSFAGFVSVWDVIDQQGVVCYTAWFYQVDSGTIFVHASTEVAAEVIQCGLECGDLTLVQQLRDAVRQAREQDVKAAVDISISTH
jgi:hypothetical protein